MRFGLQQFFRKKSLSIKIFFAFLFIFFLWFSLPFFPQANLIEGQESAPQPTEQSAPTNPENTEQSNPISTETEQAGPIEQNSDKNDLHPVAPQEAEETTGSQILQEVKALETNDQSGSGTAIENPQLIESDLSTSSIDEKGVQIQPDETLTVDPADTLQDSAEPSAEEGALQSTETEDNIEGEESLTQELEHEIFLEHFTKKDDALPLLEGKLLLKSESKVSLEESSIRLAEVELPDKQMGDPLSTQEALSTLVALNTTESDLQKKVLEDFLSENYEDITEKTLEDEITKTALGLVADKHIFQTLNGKVEEVMQTDSVQAQLAENLESEPEVDMFLETLLTPSVKEEIVQGLVEESLNVSPKDSPLSPSVPFENDYEKLALSQLLGEKIGEVYSAQVVLEQAVAQPEQEEQISDSSQSLLKVKVHGPSGTLALRSDQFSFEAGSIVMKLDYSRKITPGLYQLDMELLNPITGETEHFLQDFTWGVLAMNANKDIYKVSEEANIAIGVLDDFGKPVCNAEVTMEITAPDGTLIYPAIKNTGQCKVLDSMNMEPDYATSFVLEQKGEYVLKLTAQHANGTRVRHFILNSVESAGYTVERKAATRLYPVGSSEMAISVYFARDFNGEITDILPVDFQVPEIDQEGVLSTHGSEKHISWQVQATAGEMRTFSYRYDAPDVSPEFYTLGPLSGSGLLEKRRWEIANDEPVIAADSTTDLRGHWKFNEGVGSSAADSSSYGSTGTLNNMEPADWSASFPAVTGNVSAISFNANNENVSVADPVDGHLDFGDTDDITLTGWFKRNTFTTTDVIMAKRNSGTTADVGYFVYLPSSDQLIFEISDGVDEYTLSSPTLFTTSVWNHFAIVWDQDSAANTEIYINGVDNNAIDVGAIANVGSVANALAFRMGAESDAGNVFDGAVDDLRIYKKALSLAEIQVLAGITTVPVVTDANLSINIGTGTGGAFKVGDQIITTWNNSAGGDNNTGLTAVTANLSGWGGSATAAMTDTTTCGGTAGNNIYEACFTLVSGSIDAVNVNTAVTATNIAGSTTTSDTSNATVDNQVPFFVDNGTLTISTDNGVAGVAALNNGVSNQDKVTQSAIALAVNDGDTSTINLSTLTGQSALALATESGVVTSGTLDSATQSFTITTTDNAGNTATTPSDAISVDNITPTLTVANITVTGATGTGGDFKNGDSATGRWDNSGSGDNNADISSVSFNLSDFRSVDTSAVGTALANIWTASISGALDAQGDINNNTTVTATDDGGNLTSLNDNSNYTVDTISPSITSITSVAGDTTAPYIDTTDDSSTEIVFVSADTGTGLSACRWSTSNVAYTSMANTCASTTSCTSNLSGSGSKTVYLACIDSAGNPMPTNTQVDYTVQAGDITPPTGTSITPNSLRIIDNTHPSFVVDDGTDSESGIDTSSRVLERADATYINNTCGSFGSFAAITPSGTYPNFSDATVTGSACYKYRYSVSDNAANTTTTPETSIIVRVPITTLAISTGDNQSYGDLNTNPIGHTLATPLQVRATDGGSNWALIDEVTVDFAITATPTSPTATGQNLSATSANTDANGYAQTSLTLGDRAGNYQVQATSLHSSVTVEPTFTATAGNHFSLTVTEDDLFINLDPLSNSSDFVSPTLNFTTNAASYQIDLTPNQWPLSGIDQILNWINPLGFGWSLNAGTIAAFLESLGNPASTPVYTCSGDTCQGSFNPNIDLHAGIDFTYPPGTYTANLTFSAEGVVY